MAKKNKKRREKEKEKKKTEETKAELGIFEKEQWVNQVLYCSSEHKKSPVLNLIGKKEAPEDEKEQKLVKGWTPKKDNGTIEILEVSFIESVPVQEIQIYESYNGGAVVKIFGRPDAEEPWTKLWSTAEPEIVTEYRVFSPLLDLPKEGFRVKDVKLELDCRRSCKVTQIEGICLIGEKETLHPLKINPKTLDMTLFSDATIIVENKRFPVHKMVLSHHR
jgi:hypothetical protein